VVRASVVVGASIVVAMIASVVTVLCGSRVSSWLLDGSSWQAESTSAAKDQVHTCTALRTRRITAPA
jgi:hypothetical protein